MAKYLNATKRVNARNNKTVIASMESMVNKLDELDALLSLEAQLLDNPSLEANDPLILLHVRSLSRQYGYSLEAEGESVFARLKKRISELKNDISDWMYRTFNKKPLKDSVLRKLLERLQKLEGEDLSKYNAKLAEKKLDVLNNGKPLSWVECMDKVDALCGQATAFITAFNTSYRKVNIRDVRDAGETLEKVLKGVKVDFKLDLPFVKVKTATNIKEPDDLLPDEVVKEAGTESNFKITRDGAVTWVKDTIKNHGLVNLQKLDRAINAFVHDFNRDYDPRYASREEYAYINRCITIINRVWTICMRAMYYSSAACSQVGRALHVANNK